VDATEKNQTGLHWAVIGRPLDTVKLLLKWGAPLEAKNVYGGTALGQATWCVINVDRSADYVPMYDVNSSRPGEPVIGGRRCDVERRCRDARFRPFAARALGQNSLASRVKYDLGNVSNTSDDSGELTRTDGAAGRHSNLR